MQITALLADGKVALRGLRKRPVFALVAVLTMGLAIGANAALYSIVESTVLRPLPYQQPENLAVIFATNDRGASQGPHPPATYLELQAKADRFADIAAAELWGPTLSSDEPGERPGKITGLRVTPNLFAVLGVQPVAGRPLQPADAEGGSAPAVVITERLARRLGGVNAVLGRNLRLDGVPHSVVGVMPTSFVFPTFWVHDAEAFRALQWDAAMRENRRISTLRLFGRLRDDASVEVANSQVRAIAASLAERYPDSNRGLSAEVVPLDIATGGAVRPTVLALFAGVGVLLLVACANLAGLLLARAADRHGEMAVRKALGAGVARLASVLAAESLILLGIGAVAGIGFAAWGLSLASAQIPDGAIEAIYGARSVQVDFPVLAFTLLLCGLVAGLFGVFPALLVAGNSLTDSLREKGGTSHRRLSILRSGLVIAQSALAFSLVVLSALLLTSFRNLASADAGFGADAVLSFVAPVTGTQHGEPGRKAIFYQQLVEHLRSLPGVQAASAVNHVPLLGDEWGTTFLVEGEPTPAPGEVPRAVYRTMMPGYLEAIGARLQEGRDFQATDHPEAPPVVIVNQALAARRWPGESAIGKRLRLGGPDSREPLREVVGVVNNIQQQRWGTAVQEEVMLAFAQDPLFRDSPRAPFAMTVVVKAANGRPESLVPIVREALDRLAPDVPLAQLTPLREGIRNAFWRPRLAAATGASLAILAGLLSALGIYGALSQLVSQQQRAIGIRMALGEAPSHVLRRLLLRGMALALGGAALGWPLAVAAGRLAESVLVDVKPQELGTFAAAAVALATIGLAATILPARRAARIDPSACLRGD
jgi:predicted permease